jgi:hypothetical protein
MKFPKKPSLRRTPGSSSSATGSPRLFLRTTVRGQTSLLYCWHCSLLPCKLVPSVMGPSAILINSFPQLHVPVHLHLILAHLFIDLITSLFVENSGLRTSVPIYTDTSRALYELFGFTNTIDTAGPEDPKRAYVVDTYWEGVWKSLAVR